MTTIVFAGGGSGGHLFPGLAAAEELVSRSPATRAVFVGSNREIEQRIFQSGDFAHFPLSAVPSSAFLRSPLSSLRRNWKAYRSVCDLLEDLSPRVVVGLGGFASVPVVLAAWRWDIPILLLEQNAVLGRANRFLLPLCQQVCLSFPETPLPARGRKKARLTGNPVRREIREPALRERDRHDASPRLLILGGSQGASAVNEAVLGAFPLVQKQLTGWRILHQTGNQHASAVEASYNRLGVSAEVRPFVSDMAAVFADADLVISRAGGTSLAEFAVHGLPAVLVPYPHSIRDHQRRNAEFFARSGAAVLLEQRAQAAQTAEALANCLHSLLSDSKQRDAMGSAMLSLAHPSAAESVVDCIMPFCDDFSGSSATHRKSA